ncbi:MAG: class 1 fructose-bisphosphatase [Candidatus Promineifilaceae bacterium]
MQKLITIERFILDHQPEYAVGDFTSLLYDIALAAKGIAAKAQRAGLVDILGLAGSANLSGDAQQKLDLYADELIFRLCDHTGRLCVMASEEHEDILTIPEPYSKGRYVLVYDPLDGSSNIDVNVPTGTIFAIFRCLDWETRGRLEDCLQPGRDLVAAGYVVYSVSTMLVYSTGAGVHGFTLEPSLGEFLLSHEELKLPPEPKYYSANHAYFPKWSEGVQKYVRWLQGLDGSQQKLSERYVGSLIADFHRNLIGGGVFLYPAQVGKPAGKLRLLYEASPLAYLCQQAGGYASDGGQAILDIEPTSLHQTTPLFIGSRDLVEAAEEHIRRYDAAA